MEVGGDSTAFNFEGYIENLEFWPDQILDINGITFILCNIN